MKDVEGALMTDETIALNLALAADQESSFASLFYSSILAIGLNNNSVANF